MKYHERTDQEVAKKRMTRRLRKVRSWNGQSARVEREGPTHLSGEIGGGIENQGTEKLKNRLSNWVRQAGPREFASYKTISRLQGGKKRPETWSLEGKGNKQWTAVDCTASVEACILMSGSRAKPTLPHSPAPLGILFRSLLLVHADIRNITSHCFISFYLLCTLGKYTEYLFLAILPIISYIQTVP